MVAELARRAREHGFEVLSGRSIDLVGTELPYQPFVEALRRSERPDARRGPWESQLRLFEPTLTLLTDRAEAGPVLLVLEDVHWADVSTLDLLVYLAHHIDERRVVLASHLPPGRSPSADRMRRLADGCGAPGPRSCSSSVRSRATS